MNTFDIHYVGCLTGKQGNTTRPNIRAILGNLLEHAGCNPDKFKASVSHDSSPIATIGGDGCEFRSVDSKGLTVAVYVGSKHFVAKLHSSSCKPQTLNQGIRTALGTPGNAGFQFVGDQVYGKVKPAPPQIKPQPQPQPQQQPPQPTPIPTPIQTNMKPSTPDLKKASMSDDGLLAAHKAIYQEVGSKKTLPFHCSEARAWIEHHRIKINHHTVTGRILGHLVRRGLYLQNKVGKTWSMTPFGVEVALGQKPLPADATPKKPGRKKVSAPAAAKPDEGEAMGVVKESPMGELLTLLMLAGDDADNVRKLLKTCQRLNALDEETAVLRAEKETLIKGLYDNSAGVIVKRLEKLRMV